MTQSSVAVNTSLAGLLLPHTTTEEDPLARFIRKEESYDYKGAILYVFGLLIMYGISIFLLIISLIRKARGEFEVIDYMRDLEEMRRETRRKTKNRSQCGDRTKLGSLKSLAGLGTSKQRTLTDSLPSITEAFRQYSRPLLLGASTSERHTTIRPMLPLENLQVGSGAYRPRRSSIAIPGMARLIPPSVNLGVRRKSDGMVIGPKSPILPERRIDVRVNELGESSAIIPPTDTLSPACSYGTINEQERHEQERLDIRPPVHISLPAPVRSPTFPGREILYDPMEDRELYRVHPRHERHLRHALYDPARRRPSAHAHEAYTTARLAVVRQEMRRNSAIARHGCNYSSIEEDPEIDSRSVSPAALDFETADDLDAIPDSDFDTSSTDSEVLPAITKVWVPGVPKDPIAMHIE